MLLVVVSNTEYLIFLQRNSSSVSVLPDLEQLLIQLRHLSLHLLELALRTEGRSQLIIQIRYAHLERSNNNAAAIIATSGR
jgi:hypothetical protein